MKGKDLRTLIESGAHPLIVLTDTLYDDSWASKGFVGAVTKVVPWPDAESTWEYTIDFGGEALQNNLAIQTHDWRIYKDGEQVGTGTAFEAGFRKEGDYVETIIWWDGEDELPIEFVDLKDDSPMSEYLRVKRMLPTYDKTYVEWLESQYTSLSNPFIHPTVEEAGAMTKGDAVALIQHRVYDVGCLTERFEGAGKFLGNGHHFAQKISKEAADEFERRWNDK